MPSRDGTAANTAMKGAGYYSQRTRGAKDVIDNSTGMLLAAVDAITPPPDGPVRIADFGAADGGTSKKAMREVVAALRTRFPGRQILITYTDLPGNDFSTLFRNMQGMGPEAEDTYLTEFDGVFVHACGIGFHQQLSPDASLDIGFSATAMHYVSEKPCEIPDHVHAVRATGQAREAFAAQAAKDWEAILTARAAELRPGGRLVFLNFGVDEQGRFLGSTGGVDMFDVFHDLWRGLRDEGRITPDEYLNASFAQFYRTIEEFSAPLKDPASPVSKAGLRLISARTGLTRCPYRAAFEEAAGAMSARDFAISYIPTLRSWSETVFTSARGPDRDPAEWAAVVDLFYQRYEDRVAADPDGHAMDYIHCFIEIEKTA